MKKTVVFLVILSIFAICIYANSQIDSLESALKKAHGSDRVQILLQLSEYYLSTAPRHTIELSTEAFELASNLKEKHNLAKALTNIGEGNYRLGNYQRALSYHLNALNIFMELNEKPSLAKSHQETGMTQLRLCNYDRALYYFLNSLQIYREL
jgi:tetratricopeptide (TPR) repeat protein